MAVDILIDATAITARNDGLGYYSLFFASRAVERLAGRYSMTIVVSPSARALPLEFGGAEVIVSDHERYSGCIYDAAYLDAWDAFVAARRPRLYISTAFVPTRVDCRRVVVVHDVAPIVLGSMLRPEKVAVFSTLIAQSVAMSDVVLCASRFTASELLRIHGGAGGRLSVLYPDVAAMIRRAASTASEPHGRYLVIGIKCPRKNVTLVIDALALLAGAGRDDISVVFAGDERQEVPLRAAIEARGLSRLATVLGYVPDRELVAHIAGARAVIMPSLYEGFGMPVVEALAAGTPVLSTGAAAVREVAGDAAEYVAPDAAALADALSRTHRRDQPVMRQRIDALRAINEQQFAAFFAWCEGALTPRHWRAAAARAGRPRAEPPA